MYNWLRSSRMRVGPVVPYKAGLCLASAALVISSSSAVYGFLIGNSDQHHHHLLKPYRHQQNQRQQQTTTTASVAYSSPSLVKMSAAAPSDTTVTSVVPSWDALSSRIGETAVGAALNDEIRLRKEGKGSAHVHNTLRLFDSTEEAPSPKITLYRDHAGWCPYCEKTMLLVEEKRIPIHISLVNMRSYGDKPQEFLRKVPNGLLPAIEVDGRVITESGVIMELLDQWHAPADGYRPMLPAKDDTEKWAKYERLARLERELFSWWCTLVFRPEGPRLGGVGGDGNNPLSRLLGGLGGGNDGGDDDGMSSAMQGFMECIRTVDKYLASTKGPWFFDEHDYPTMIDFIYVSHVERMLASCAYWKGLDLRDPKWKLNGLNAWLEAFEKREAYLAFKSDYFTNVMDIPPQYGPGYDGGYEEERKRMSRNIIGRDGSWQLPLDHDDPVQPLYRGPPLPVRVLDSVGLTSDANGSFDSCDPKTMENACREMAAHKLSSNGANVSRFAARGGPKGSSNPRKTFGAQLADPYADPDSNVQPHVDAALRVICSALMDTGSGDQIPGPSYEKLLRENVPMKQTAGVTTSLGYLRDRIGVPRDLPLASARYLRAYLNWAIDVINR